jgi:hypothetical protein
MRIRAIIGGGSVITATALATLAAFSFARSADTSVSAPLLHRKSIIMLAKRQQPAPGKAQITQWIGELISGNSTAQKRAEQRLIAAGDAAVPALKMARRKTAPPQGTRRLHLVLNAIAVTDALHGPLVSFRSKNCTLRDAIAAVCADAGLGCQLPRKCKRLSERFGINIQHQLFWNVLLRIAQLTGISPKAEYGPLPGLVFSRHGELSNGAQVAVNGAFAVVIESASLHPAKQRQTTGQKAYAVQLVCNTFSLPAGNAFVQIRSPKALLASDNKARKLHITGNLFSPDYFSINGQIISSYPGTLTIEPVAPASHEISRLVLNARVALSMDPEFQSADNLNSGRAEIDACGMRLLFGKPKLAKRKWGVSMNISTPPWLAKSLPVRAFLSRMPFSSSGPFVFTKADGKAIGNPSPFGGGYNPKRQYDFYPLASQPSGVFVKTYGRMVAVNVPFLFTHIAIPSTTTSPPVRSAPQPPMVTLENIKVSSQPPTAIVATRVVMLPESRHNRTANTKIKGWIRNLGSTSHAARAAAGRQLIRAGDSAVPAVKTALDGWTTPRMRRRLRYVLAAIAKADALRGPLLTLNLTNAPLRTILKQLCAQAGFSAQFVDLHLAMAARRLTINVKRQLFWKVIQRIALSTDVSPQGNDAFGPGLFTFYQPGAFDKDTPVYTSGALLLAVERTRTDQTINFDADRKHRQMGGFAVHIRGFWALGDSQIAGFGPVRFSRAVDNHGISLLASAKTPVEVDFPAVDYEFHFDPDLRWPRAGSTAIRLLEGELPITLAVTPRVKRIRHLDSGKAAVLVDGIHIRWGKPAGVVENASIPRLDRCTIHVNIIAGANSSNLATAKLFMQSLPQEKSFVYSRSVGGVLGFRSKSGRQLSCRLGRQASGAGWNYLVHIRGGLPATAWAKVYTRFIRVHIPFSFHNLPIPRFAGMAINPKVAPGPTGSPSPSRSSLIMRSRLHPVSIQANQLTAWLHQLTSQSLAQRHAANRHLMIAGDAAVPAIQKALRHADDPALRQQLLSLIDSITAERDLRGPLVSLNVQHVPLQAALEQLCSQAGIAAYYDQLPTSPLENYVIRGEPFWTVLRRIAKLTHIGPMGNRYSDYRLRFAHRNLFGRDVPVAIHGACALAIQSLRRYDNNWLVPVDPVNKKRNFAASCFVLWAPADKAILDQVGGLHAVEIITNPRGKVLLTAAVKASQNVWPHNHEDVLFPFELHLPWPPPDAASLALRGILRIYLSGEMRTLYIKNLGLGHHTLTVDGMTLAFGKPRPIAGGWNIRLHIGITQGFSYHGKTSHWLPFAQMPIEHRFTRNLFGGKELRFYGPAGHPHPMAGHSGGARTSRGWGVYRYTLNITGTKPQSAAINFFTRTVRVKVPFHFKNLPIPR